MRQDESGNNIGTAITFLLVGLGAGAVMGMLFTPKTGRQMRRDLRRGYENARESFDDWRESFDDWKETARDIAEDAIERGSDLADDLKDRIRPLTRGMRRS